MQQALIQNLNSLKLSNGFYKASVSSEYNYIWLRDNFYCSLPDLWNNPEGYKKTYQTWLDYYISIEDKYNKFSSLINKKRLDATFEFPHPRINIDLTEIHTGWSLQTDHIGYFLLGLSKGLDKGLDIIRGEGDILIIKKIISLLEELDYTNISESGAWEENDEPHRASTIGSIVSGLLSTQKYFEVKKKSISDGLVTLYNMLPNETSTRQYDLAQLFLIYPFNILTKDMEDIIINNIGEHLLKENGVIRYKGDKYFNVNGEAEWVIGFSLLGLIYYRRGDINKALYFYNKTLLNGVDIPELYFSNTNIPNKNTPLGWSLALTIELGNLLKDLI